MSKSIHAVPVSVRKRVARQPVERPLGRGPDPGRGAGPRAAALSAAALEIERRWGLRASGRLFAGRHAPPVALPTGLPELDAATGFGGVPRGKITQIAGASSSGKLTLALRTVASAQARGGLAAYVDLPGAFYPPAAAAMGVDLARLVIVRPPDAHAALKAACALLHGEGFDALLLDLANAPIHSDFLARIAGLAARGAAAAIFVTSPPGGPVDIPLPVGEGPRVRASGAYDTLRFFASLRLAVSRRGWLWREGALGRVPAGARLEVSVLKTRTAAGLRSVVVDCPFLWRPCDEQDPLPLDSRLPDRPRDSGAPGLGTEAPGHLRAAV